MKYEDIVYILNNIDKSLLYIIWQKFLSFMHVYFYF